MALKDIFGLLRLFIIIVAFIFLIVGYTGDLTWGSASTMPTVDDMPACDYELNFKADLYKKQTIFKTVGYCPQPIDSTHTSDLDCTLYGPNHLTCSVRAGFQHGGIAAIFFICVSLFGSLLLLGLPTLMQNRYGFYFVTGSDLLAFLCCMITCADYQYYLTYNDFFTLELDNAHKLSATGVEWTLKSSWYLYLFGGILAILASGISGYHAKILREEKDSLLNLHLRKEINSL
jgi:hypothetical protein